MKYSGKYNKYRSRSRSNDRSFREQKPIDFTKRRKEMRERSNSALREMKIKSISNGIGIYQKIYEKPKDKFWDGYQWVKKDMADIVDVVKPGNTVIISNVPLHIKININDFIDFLEDQMVKKDIISKNDKLKTKVITSLELNQDNNSSVVILPTPEIAKRMILLDGIKLLGSTLRVSPYIQTKLEENTFKGQIALANSADLSAKSNAIAISAFESFNQLSKKDITNQEQSTDLMKMVNQTNYYLSDNRDYRVIPKEAIKIMNYSGNEVLKMSKEKYIELKERVKKEFDIFGSISFYKVISSQRLVTIGVELGDVFIEYYDIDSAIKAYEAMNNKSYNNKVLKLAYIDKYVLHNEIIKNS